jgi:hypothetical protein
MSSVLMRSYSEAYEDVDEGFYIQKYARILAHDMAGRCLGEWRTAFSVLESAMLPAHGIFAHDPSDGPLGRRLEQNTPMGPISTPVMIAQGDQDDLVLPDIQRRYVAARCAAGQRIDFRIYSGRNHQSITSSDSLLVPDLIDWTRDRLAGRPGSANCAPLESQAR